MTQIQASMLEEPFLAVLEYILIPKYINFYGKVDHYRWSTVGESKDSQSVETSFVKS
jgi:hypothetical protein